MWTISKPKNIYEDAAKFYNKNPSKISGDPEYDSLNETIQ